MNFYYWSPFISNVATVKAVLNSEIIIKKFSKKSIQLLLMLLENGNNTKK